VEAYSVSNKLFGSLQRKDSDKKMQVWGN